MYPLLLREIQVIGSGSYQVGCRLIGRQAHESTWMTKTLRWFMTLTFEGNLPRKNGLYDPANEKDGCGVGFVCDIKGRPSHELLHGTSRRCRLRNQYRRRRWHHDRPTAQLIEWRRQGSVFTRPTWTWRVRGWQHFPAHRCRPTRDLQRHYRASHWGCGANSDRLARVTDQRRLGQRGQSCQSRHACLWTIVRRQGRDWRHGKWVLWAQAVHDPQTLCPSGACWRQCCAIASVLYVLFVDQRYRL